MINNNDVNEQVEQIEEFSVNGAELLSKVKELIEAGNARRIIIQKETGGTIIEIPLTIGAIGTVLVPLLAAVGAIAALVTKCSIVVVKREKVKPQMPADTEPGVEVESTDSATEGVGD